MQALSTEGLCELRASKGASKGAEPMLASLSRRHPSYTGHMPWEDSSGEAEAAKAAATAAAGAAGALLPVTIVWLYRPSHAQQPLFLAAGCDDTKAFYDTQQAAVGRHVGGRDAVGMRDTLAVGRRLAQ